MAKRQHSPDYRGGHSYAPLGLRRTMMSKSRARALRHQGFTNDRDDYYSNAHASASAIFRTLGQVNHHIEDFYRNHDNVHCPELAAVQHYAREAERRFLEDLVPQIHQDLPDIPDVLHIQPPVQAIPVEDPPAEENPPVMDANPDVSVQDTMEADDVNPPAEAAPEEHGQL